MLPDLADALEHMRLEAGFDDAKVQACLDAAIDLVGDFLDRGSLVDASSSSEGVEITESIRAAILMIAEKLYDGRSAGDGVVLGVNSTEWMLLYPKRRVGV